MTIIKGEVKTVDFDKGTQELINKVKNRKLLNEKIGIIAATSVKRTILAGGRPIKWKGLSQWTRNERGENAKPLIASARGLMSIQRVDNSVPNLVATNDFSSFGTELDYFAFHNEGGRTKEMRIPGVVVKAHRRITKSGTIASVRTFTRTQFVGSHVIPKREYLLLQREDWPVIFATIGDHIASEN